MQEVVNKNGIERFVDINDPVSAVRLLPDATVPPNPLRVKSVTVETQNSLLQQRYAQKVAEYDVGFKSIVAKVDSKLNDKCKLFKIEFHKDSLVIDQHLMQLNDCTSAELYLAAWDFVTQSVTKMFIKINKLGDFFTSVEQERLERIKNHMQEYYIDVHDHFKSDKLMLNDFFEKEISEFNSVVLENYQSYSDLISKLKVKLVQQLCSWHNSWELLLFSWRDCVIRKNIENIEKLSKDKAFLVPEKLESYRESCFLALNHAEESIDEILRDLAHAMPASIELVVQTFDQIGNIFSHCQNAITEYRKFIVKCFDEKFCKLTEHIGKMRGYLTSNSVFEENNSLELFEYSIFNICEEFERRIEVIQDEYLEEINKKYKSKEKLCENIKEYIFLGCNAWGLYKQEYENAKEKFISQFEHKFKTHKNMISCFEKALNKSCGLLAESRTLKQVDKRFEDVTKRLNKIFSEYVRYQNVLEGNVESKVNEWLAVEKELACTLLSKLCIKIASEQTDLETTFIAEGIIHHYHGDCSANSFEFKFKCSQHYMTKMYLLKKSNLQDLEKSLSVHVKQALNDLQIRKDLHLSRLAVIKKEIYAVRVEEITQFSRDCDRFWDEVTLGEQKFTNLYQKLCSDTSIILQEFDGDLEELKMQMTDKETSGELILLYPQIEQKGAKRIGELNDLVNEFQSKIVDYKKYIRNIHDLIITKSETKSLKLHDEIKIKSEFEEFAELADDMKIKAETERQKTAKIKDGEDKALSHYKHTIFCMFYLEKKKEILKECRMKIKTASVLCSREVLKFENNKKTFSSQLINPSLEKNDDLIKEFEGLYSLCKAIINMLNYSTGINEDLAHCVSMDRLERRYRKFVDGKSRSIDSGFLKEIARASSANSQAGREHELLEHNTRDELSWRIPRVKVVRELIGKTLRYFKYGVGVRPEINYSDHNINNSKAASLKKFGLEARSDNYWAAHLLGKKNACVSQDEHDSIVAKACAKLRDRRNSRINRKSFEASLPLLQQQKGVQINNRFRIKKPSTTLPPITQGSILETKEDTGGLCPPPIEKSISYEQIDMDGALRLSRTIEFLMGPSLRPNSTSSGKGSSSTGSCSSLENRTERYFDFLTTPDETLKNMIFQPIEFFGFKKRSLDVDATANQIISVPEKTKYFLRNSFEQFAVTSEIYYRQKNIVITKQGIPKEIDIACKDMEYDLQLYLDKVEKFCVDGVKKMKDLVYELISCQEKFITSLFFSVSSHLDSYGKNFVIDLESKFQTTKLQVSEEQEALFAQLNPYMCHPNQHSNLAKLQKLADQLCDRFAEQFKILHINAINAINELHMESIAKIQKYKISMYCLADITIHPSKVKKISRAKFRGVQHEDCLQDHMPGDSPRKLYKLFLENAAEMAKEVEKQQTKFYDHIAVENARAVVHANTWHHEKENMVNEMFHKEQVALKKWHKYWNRNIQELVGDCQRF
ncbi:hypothetical protein ACHWQZ_G004219 [Mnemiopsis leidyi]